MMLVRFKSHEDHEDILKKVKKMKKFAEELENCLEDVIDDEEPEYRGGRYRHDYEEDDMRHDGRYGYRRSSRRM